MRRLVDPAEARAAGMSARDARRLEEILRDAAERRRMTRAELALVADEICALARAEEAVRS